jgi:hypothetical protein
VGLFKDVEPRGLMFLTNARARPLPSGQVDDLQLKEHVSLLIFQGWRQKVHALDQGKEQPHPHLYLLLSRGVSSANQCQIRSPALPIA